jgi:hypothetical protein
MVVAVKICVNPACRMGGKIVPERSDHGAGAHRSRQSEVSEFGILCHSHGQEAIGTYSDLIIETAIELEGEGQADHAKGIGTHLITFVIAGIGIGIVQQYRNRQLEELSHTSIIWGIDMYCHTS